MSCDYNQRRFSMCALRSGLSSAASKTASVAGAALKRVGNSPELAVGALSTLASAASGAGAYQYVKHKTNAVNADIGRFNELLNEAGLNAIFALVPDLDEDDLQRGSWLRAGPGDQKFAGWHRENETRKKRAKASDGFFANADKAVAQMDDLLKKQRKKAARQAMDQRLSQLRQAITMARLAEGHRQAREFAAAGFSAYSPPGYDVKAGVKAVKGALRDIPRVPDLSAQPEARRTALAVSAATALGASMLGFGALKLRAKVRERRERQNQSKDAGAPRPEPEEETGEEAVEIQTKIISEALKIKRDLNQFIKERGRRDQSGQFTRLDAGDGRDIILSRAEVDWYADKGNLGVPDKVQIPAALWAEQFEPERRADGGYRLYETAPPNIPVERIWALRLDETGREYAIPGPPADRNALGYYVTGNEWHSPEAWKVSITED